MSRLKDVDRRAGREVIHSLQVGRGVAAVAVVAHHAAVSTDAFVGTVPAAWLRAFDLGAYGVDFFFVLSGFIIMHAHLHEGGRPGAIGGYVFKRLTRIFPAYWPVGLAVLVLYAALPGLSASGGREFSVLSSVLLLPADRPPALSVAWTLVHELMFYGVFMLWFVSRRAFWGGVAVWTVAIALSYAAGGATGWLRYPLGLLNVEFMLGVLAAVAYRRGLLTQRAGMLIAGGGIAGLRGAGGAVRRAGGWGGAAGACAGAGGVDAGSGAARAPVADRVAGRAAGAGQCELLDLPGA